MRREQIKLGRELGEGQFGKVFEGSTSGLQNGDTGSKLVAVKLLNSSLDMQDQVTFVQEALRMRYISHRHIVRLLGVCFKTVPGFIVLEHMAKGDLKAYLQRSKTSAQPLNTFEMLRMSAQVASALSYLSEMRYVHRDIAARNVLVDEDETLKLADFGLGSQLILLLHISSY